MTWLCLTILYMEFSLASKLHLYVIVKIILNKKRFFALNPRGSIWMYATSLGMSFSKYFVYRFSWVATTNLCNVNIFFIPRPSIFTCVHCSQQIFTICHDLYLLRLFVGHVPSFMIILLKATFVDPRFANCRKESDRWCFQSKRKKQCVVPLLLFKV